MSESGADPEAEPDASQERRHSADAAADHRAGSASVPAEGAVETDPADGDGAEDRADGDGADGNGAEGGADGDGAEDRANGDGAEGGADGDGDEDGDCRARRVEVHPGKEVVVEFDPDLTFECVDDCTWCCHHGVLLYDRDLIELAARANLAETTTDFRAEPFVAREPKGREAHVADDGQACAFLDADGLCRLQREDDRDWKPTRCSVFPLAVRREDGDLRVDVRDSAHEHCEGLGVSDRRVIDELDAFLPELLWELENPDSERVL